MDQFITPYLQLQEQLQSLSDRLNSPTLVTKDAIQQGQGLMALWQGELASIQGDNLPAEAFSQWRSLQTELYRELRLLNVDLMFLRSSRSPQTQASKKKAVGDRLEKLLQYCIHLQTLTTADPSDKPEA